MQQYDFMSVSTVSVTFHVSMVDQDQMYSLLDCQVINIIHIILRNNLLCDYIHYDTTIFIIVLIFILLLYY